MGRKIIKQPNGKYCVFSTVVDDIIMYDCIKEDIIDERVQEAREDITKNINNLIEKLDYENLPEHLTLKYNLEWIEEVHGKERGEEIKKMIIKDENDNKNKKRN